MGIGDRCSRSMHLCIMILNYFSARSRWPGRVLVLIGLSTCLATCQLHAVEQIGALVPPTADQVPTLLQLSVTVAGHRRALHLQTFGNPNQPVLFALPGGPGADFRLLLPLKALSDRYYVVLWDPRGTGQCQ